MRENPDEFPYFPSHDEVYNLLHNAENYCILEDNWLCEYVNTVFPAIKLPANPTSIEDALNHPIYGAQWEKEIQKEFDNFDSHNIFGEAAPTGHAMKTKLILKYMFNNDYTIKLKARLVACGYSQIYGIDYKETYAPTTSCVAVFLMFQIGTSNNCKFAMFDVSAAFLEGKNDFKQFARMPPALFPSADGKGLRVEVIGNFYGEKQGPKIWNDHLDNILKTMNFERCPVHPCIYRKIEGNNFIVLTVHVDDGLMFSKDDVCYV
jgi:hypothetical protein